MSDAPKPPPRKNVALPPDVVERVDAFRKSQNINSESDALRRLIEVGLNFFDTPMNLFERCALSHKNGSQIGEIIVNILNDHPQVNTLIINSDTVRANLKGDHFIEFDKFKGSWSFGTFEYDRDTPTHYFPSRNGMKSIQEQRINLDDEIPF